MHIMAHIHPGGWTQAHVCAALGTAAHFVCLAQGLEGLDICARELGIDGRCPAAVAAACGNAPVVEEYIWREMGPLDVTDAQRRTLLDIVCAQEAAADGALACSGRRGGGQARAISDKALAALWDAVLVLDRWPLRPSRAFVSLVAARAGVGRQGLQGAGGVTGTENGLDAVREGVTLMSLACTWGDVGVVRRLLEVGASADAGVRAFGGDGRGPGGAEGGAGAKQRWPMVGGDGGALVVACRGGEEELVRVLLTGGARVEVMTHSVALHVSARRAVEEGSAARVRWCERVLFGKERGSARETPLVTCLRHRKLDLVPVLLSASHGPTCDVGWARDPYAPPILPTEGSARCLSALMVLLLIGPTRDRVAASPPTPRGGAGKPDERPWTGREQNATVEALQPMSLRDPQP